MASQEADKKRDVFKRGEGGIVLCVYNSLKISKKNQTITLLKGLVKS